MRIELSYEGEVHTPTKDGGWLKRMALTIYTSDVLFF